MIKEGQGDILDSKVDALVNTVNCIGIMGKGLALQVKGKFPDNYKAYSLACKRGDVRLGKVFIFDCGEGNIPRYIFNFPTKNHWRELSSIDSIRDGLISLKEQIIGLGIRSIAIPPLGCGNGGLDWRNVRPLIENSLRDLQDVEISLFAPGVFPKPTNSTTKPNEKLTPSRAMLIRIFAEYRQIGYPLTPIEIQKLAYFLQEAGEPLRLRFTKGEFGPFADNLRFVIERMKGQYLMEVGQKDYSELAVTEEAASSANELLSTNSEASDRVSSVLRTINGFETPYGLELLATVHWAMTKDGANDIEQVASCVKSWNPRKAKVFDSFHIQKAYERLLS